MTKVLHPSNPTSVDEACPTPHFSADQNEPTSSSVQDVDEAGNALEFPDLGEPDLDLLVHQQLIATAVNKRGRLPEHSSTGVDHFWEAKLA